MKNAILVPGRPDKEEFYDPAEPTTSNNHWFPWLTKQLMLHDILTVSIEMPAPWQPRYEAWKREFERFEITEDTLLVGHSCGGGFLVRWLSEHRQARVGKVVLVAPWLNPDDNPASDTADFFHFNIDADIVSRTRGMIIFNSDNDGDSIHKSVSKIRSAVTAVGYREFHDYGHFCKEDMNTLAFPELAQELLA